ncbi:MAG: SprT-like domain-containing protein [Bacteroidetes bacterium]|jgi:hypothetical protein|nr:SprT-like domain-containing protein [Bacteroidota bacterium]
MPINEHPMQALAGFLPDKSFEQVLAYLHEYRVHLTITKQRKSVLGDYRHPGRGANHRISINGNLNKYEFLITFLHELAHLLTFEKFSNRVEAHGKEWKFCYGQLLQHFVAQQIFPPDIEKALQKSILNPAATAGGETELLMVLRGYNEKQKPGYALVASVAEGSLFVTDNGRVFCKGPLRRKRYECTEVKTGLRYTFSALSEVKPISNPQ